MNNLPVVVDEKKKNIFQEIRLSLYKRNKKITFEKYQKAPDYIKKDRDIILKVLMENSLSDEELLQMPANLLAEIYTKSREQVKYYRNYQKNNDVSESEELVKHIEYYKKVYEKFKRKPKTKLAFIKDKKMSLKSEDDIALIINEIDKNQEYNTICQLDEKDKNRLLSYTLSNRTDITGKFLNYMSEDEKRKIINIENKLLKDADYSFQLGYIKDNKEMMKYASLDLQKQIIEKEPEMLKNAEVNLQRAYIQENKEQFHLASIEIQLECIKNNKDFIERASKSAINAFLELDKNNFKFLTSKLQNEYLANNIELYEYASDEVKKGIRDEYFNLEGFANADYKSQVAYIIKKELEFTIEKYGLSSITVEEFEEKLDKFGREVYKNIYKLLSSESIMENISEGQFKEFINSGGSYECIVDIVKSNYDEVSQEIIQDRNGLTMRDIPNFDIFDSNIREVIGYGGVHAFLTYDMESADVITKLANDSNLLEKYKKYTELIGDFYPNSAIGLEEKLLSFDRHQELFDNLLESDVSDENKKNLLLMLRDEEIVSKIHTNIEVKTIDDLSKYNELRNQRFNEEIKNETNCNNKKELTLLKYFGVITNPSNGCIRKYDHKKFLDDYLTFNGDEFSDFELDCIELYSIIEEIDSVRSIDDINKYLEQRETISPVDMKKVDSKVIENYKKEYLDLVFTVKDAQRLVDEDENSFHYIQKKDNSKVYRDRKELNDGTIIRCKMSQLGEIIFKEEKNDEILYKKNGQIGDFEAEFDNGAEVEYNMEIEDGDYEVYDLDKIDKRLSLHAFSGYNTVTGTHNFASIEERIINEKEQEHFMNSISMRYDMNREETSESLSKIQHFPWMGYTDIDPNGIIGHHRVDAGTTHKKKCLRIGMNETNIEEIFTTIPKTDSEIAILRYEYDLSKIKQGTRGGKKIADFFMGKDAEKFAIALSKPVIKIKDIEKSRIASLEKRESKRQARIEDDKMEEINKTKEIRDEGDER